MTAIIFRLFVATSIILSAYAGNAIDTKTLRTVFGTAQAYKPIGPLPPGSSQVAAVTPRNGTLVDPDYWDPINDLAPDNLNYDPFDWTLTSRVAMSTEDNFLVSPLGLKLALAILAEAATGRTQNEIISVLGLDTDRHVIRNKFSNIIESLKKESPEYILNLGSRIYVGKNAIIRQRYAAIAQSFYNTDLKQANFLNPVTASREINQWVYGLTQGRIPNLVSPDDVQGLVVMILNALYFKGTWRRQFPTNETKDAQFYVTPTIQKRVPFMHVRDKFFFMESTRFDAKIIRLRYMGNKFAMYLIVPNTIMGIPRIMSSIVFLRDELQNLDEYIVDVSLPRFKFEYTARYERILKDLGIRTAFEDTASFPGISRGQSLDQLLTVSRIQQMSGAEVNEIGSVVFSATEIGIVNKFGEGSETPFELVANKPFIFFIQDDTTKQLLFTGRVSDPSIQEGQLKY